MINLDRALWKAKRKDNGEWITGYYAVDIFHDKHALGIPGDPIINPVDFIEIDPETLCQCTGLKDKNGKLIFENDKIKEGDVLHDGEVQIYGQVYIVEFECGCWVLRNNDKWTFIDEQRISIIGNIHDGGKER